MAKESSNPDTECKTAFWLVPAREDAGELETIIEQLALRHAVPMFSPHVTILCANFDRGTAVAGPVRLLGDLARSVAPLSLEARGLDAEPSFTKSLFVRFAIEPVLEQLRQALAAHAAEPDHVPFDPHLSLIYANIPMETKRELAKKIALTKSRYRFDRIQAVRIPRPTRSASDVRLWSFLGERVLGIDPERQAIHRE